MNNYRFVLTNHSSVSAIWFLALVTAVSCSDLKNAQRQAATAPPARGQDAPTAGSSTAAVSAMPQRAESAISLTPKELPATIPASAHPLDAMLQFGHSMVVTTLDFSPDGKRLASGGYGATIILWDLTSGEELRRFSGHDAPVIRVLFSRNGSRLISSDLKGGIKEWDVNSGAVIASFKVRNSCRRLAFSADSQTVALGIDAGEEASNSRIEVRRAESGKLLHTIKTDWGEVTAMAVTANGSVVASGTQGSDDDEPDFLVREWDLSTGVKMREFHVGGMAISVDGRFVTDIDFGTGTVTEKNVSTGQKIWQTTVGGGLMVVPSPDGQKLAVSVSGSAAMKILSTSNGQVVREFPAGKQTSPGSLDAMAFSNDGRFVAAASYEDEGIKIWDLSSGQAVRALAPQLPVTALAASPDGKWLAVGSEKAMWLWDLPTHKRQRNLWNGSVNQMVFSTDGRFLAANAGSQFPGETLKVWDTKAWTIAGDFKFPQKGTPFSSFAFMLGDSPLKSLGPLSRSFEFTFDGERRTIWSAPSPVSVSPDGKLLAAKVGIGGDVDLWDLQSGQRLRTIPAHKINAFAIAFSHDGKWLLTAGQETPVKFVQPGQISPTETRVKIWDTSSWTEHLSFVFNRFGAGAASFSPDARTLIVQSDWNLVELFDVASGASIGAYTATDPRTQTRQFSSGNLLITSDGVMLMQAVQNGVRIWRVAGAQKKTPAAN